MIKNANMQINVLNHQTSLGVMSEEYLEIFLRLIFLLKWKSNIEHGKILFYSCKIRLRVTVQEIVQTVIKKPF
jgi:hypothetical protein